MAKYVNPLIRYGQVITDAVDATEGMQARLSPLYTPLRQAIDANELASYDLATYQDTQIEFAQGTAAYRQILNRLEKVKAPARLIGLHKQLVATYATFVAACQDMTDALGKDRQLDVAAFDAAEAQQDAAMMKFTQQIQKISARIA